MSTDNNFRCTSDASFGNLASVSGMEQSHAEGSARYGRVEYDRQTEEERQGGRVEDLITWMEGGWEKGAGENKTFFLSHRTYYYEYTLWI